MSERGEHAHGGCVLGLLRPVPPGEGAEELSGPGTKGRVPGGRETVTNTRGEQATASGTKAYALRGRSSGLHGDAMGALWIGKPESYPRADRFEGESRGNCRNKELGAHLAPLQAGGLGCQRETGTPREGLGRSSVPKGEPRVD